LRIPLLATVAVAALAACGDDSAAPAFSTVAVSSTAYVTVPARTTTSTLAPVTQPPTAANGDSGGGGDGGNGADDDEAEQSTTTEADPTRERAYEIQSGDYLVGIADDFDVPVDFIVAYNAWPDGLQHALNPGDQIRIPPADYDPDAAAADTGGPPGETVAGGGASANDSDAGGTCPDGAAAGTYTIRSGDFPARVAQANGTTVAELDAANQGVAGYAGFVVGVVINLPC